MWGDARLSNLIYRDFAPRALPRRSLPGLHRRGTTGRPKAVLWRQADIYVSAMAGAEGATAESIAAAAGGGGRGWPVDEALERVMTEDWGMRVALGRAGRPDEVGDVIAFLLSERAGYLTGATINVDGGTDF